MKTRACDILMPDLQRIGGLTEMRKVAALSASFDMPVSTHILPNKTCILQGEVVIPERAGTGFTFNANAVKRYACQG